MEVSQPLKSDPNVSPPSAGGFRSIFDCEPTEIDSILGRTVLGDRFLRMDRPHQSNGHEDDGSNFGQQEPPTKIETLVQPKLTPLLEADFLAMERSERLARLLRRDQAWYDARQRAVQSAEQTLTLCELHQESWLHLPPKSLQP